MEACHTSVSRIAITCWLSLAMGIAAPGNETPVQPAAVFCDVEYELAWIDTGEGDRSRTNEYLREGESLEQWSSMMAVRQWPHRNQVRDVTKPYLDPIRHLFVRDAKVFAPDSGGDDKGLVVELYLAPSDKSYLEYNLIRFCTEPGEQGVKSYQFAARGPYDLPLAQQQNQRLLAQRLDALSKLTLKMHLTMPEAATAP